MGRKPPEGEIMSIRKTGAATGKIIGVEDPAGQGATEGADFLRRVDDCQEEHPETGRPAPDEGDD
jgi:hypothetical protein